MKDDSNRTRREGRPLPLRADLRFAATCTPMTAASSTSGCARRPRSRTASPARAARAWPSRRCATGSASTGQGGFDALKPKPRKDIGSARAIPQAVIDLLVSIKDEHRDYSVSMVIDAVKKESAAARDGRAAPLHRAPRALARRRDGQGARGPDDARTAATSPTSTPASCG